MKNSEIINNVVEKHCGLFSQSKLLKLSCACLFLVISSKTILAQPIPFTINHFNGLIIDQEMAKVESLIMASVKPFINCEQLSISKIDSLKQIGYGIKNRKNFFYKKLRKESLLKVDSNNFFLSLDPLFQFEAGKEFNNPDSSYYINTRGVLIRGGLGNYLAFESVFLENQGYFVNYVDSFIRKWEVVPGQGRVKKFKTNGFDYATAMGLVVFKPLKWLNITAGSGKQFIGFGYRSLLLSDNSFNYPFAKFNISKGKLSYTVCWSSLQIIYNGRYIFNQNSEPLFRKKTFTYQYLSYKPLKRVEVGFFQGVMWQAQQPGNTYFDLQVLNPIIMTHTAQFGLNNQNNVLLGGNLQLKLSNQISIYTQTALDDINNNQFGIQGGVKYFNVANIPQLYFQAEYNKVNPFTFSYPDSYQSFSHYNQPLAHPLGANFNELVFISSYVYKGIFMSIKYNYIVVGKDGKSLYCGNDILTAYTSFDKQNFAMTNKATIEVIDARVGYMINKSSDLNINFGLLRRDEKGTNNKNNTQYVYFGIQTNLGNKYYDF